jgi:hypothetical protein
VPVQSLAAYAIGMPLVFYGSALVFRNQRHSFAVDDPQPPVFRRYVIGALLLVAGTALVVAGRILMI